MASAGASDAVSVEDASVGMGVGAGVGHEVAVEDPRTALSEGGVVEVVELVPPAAPHPPTATVSATRRTMRDRLIAIEPPFLRHCRRCPADSPIKG
jgi:hypothetical protein